MQCHGLIHTREFGEKMSHRANLPTLWTNESVYDIMNISRQIQFLCDQTIVAMYNINLFNRNT